MGLRVKMLAAFFDLKWWIFKNLPFKVLCVKISSEVSGCKTLAGPPCIMCYV